MMQHKSTNRRDFLFQSAALVAGTLFAGSPTARAAVLKRTATDQVTLGRTGLKLSRLGLGTGSNSGRVQFDLGQDGFNRLVKYAYDKGVTYFDCAQSYKTFDWIGDAVKDFPREKIFLLSKIGGNPEKPMEVIERHLRTFKTDYIDCILAHCATKDTWMEDNKRLLDALDEAKQKKLIRAKGVSCHSLPALKVAAASGWVDVNLVRVNPQAKHIDGLTMKWDAAGVELDPVLREIRTMDANGHGVIGMKIIGNGDFTNPDDREKSIRFAMSMPEIDAVTIGCKSPGEIDEAIERMNRALA